MSMNEERHTRTPTGRYFQDLVKGDGDGAEKHENSTTNICRCWT
jgi:poly-beta-hydroxyalkanoate depolymerase